MVASVKRKKSIIILALLLFAFNSKAQVVINEVMHWPVGNQRLINQGSEYVELYNPTCNPIDISCYIIATAYSNDANPGSTFTTGGGIIIPQGIVLQPKAHYVIGTSKATATPSDVDFDTDINTNSYCVTNNFVLPNGDGWVALYNNAGIVQDAIYWTVDPNGQNKVSTDDDFNDNPCIPTFGCNNTITKLQSAKEISETFPNRISYVGQRTVDPPGSLTSILTTDKTFSRIPDGGTWQRDIVRSISGNNCNGGTCASSPTPTFDPIGPLCLNSTAPALPLTSNNGIDGTWDITTISTSTEGTTTYTFTPTASGGCAATTATLDIVVNKSITPTFDSKGPFCKDAPLTLPILPETSNNGIKGKWNPASLSTAVAGNIVYTFTPTNTSGQCGATTTLTVLVEENNASAKLESDAGTDNQTVSINTPIKPIKYGFSPAAGLPGVTVNVSGLPEGVTFGFPVPGASSLSITGTPTTSVGSPFTYTLTVKGNCEPVILKGVIQVTDPLCINLNNSFSPNGDGINELWKVYDNFSCLQKVKVAVYNRYGSKVYESNDYKNTWDGRYKNSSVPDGTYYAVVVYTLSSGKVIEKRTDLTILR